MSVKVRVTAVPVGMLEKVRSTTFRKAVVNILTFTSERPL